MQQMWICMYVCISRRQIWCLGRNEFCVYICSFESYWYYFLTRGKVACVRRYFYTGPLVYAK
jgi:hypothetical protein